MDSPIPYIVAIFFLIVIGIVVGIFIYVLREFKKTPTSPKSQTLKTIQSAPPTEIPPTSPPATPQATPPSVILPTQSPVTIPIPPQATAAPAAKPEPATNAKLYRRSQLSRAEGFFYDFLKTTVGENYIITFKTPLSEMFRIEGWLGKGHYTMYSNGHVDFVLLEPTLKMPILGIELDGTTHTDPAQIDRDTRKEELFHLSDIKLLRFRVGVTWGEKERTEILAALPKPLKSQN